jgi:hypothetical protein
VEGVGGLEHPDRAAGAAVGEQQALQHLVRPVGGEDLVDPEILKNAAATVLHYFRVELCRDTVTLGEFSEALERVLRKFGVSVQSKIKGAPGTHAQAPVAAKSLVALAREAGNAGELAFFPVMKPSGTN